MSCKTTDSVVEDACVLENLSFVLQERKKRGETDEQAFLADVYAYQVGYYAICQC